MNLKSQKHYDLLVIGSGSAGIRAAVQAAKLQKKVAIIEKSPDHIGGSWIRTGTLPSKTLRESLEAIHTIRFHMGSEWVKRLVNDLSSSQLFGRAMSVADQEEKLVRRILEKNKIELITGFGYIEDKNHMRVLPSDGLPKVYSSDYILIATGSRTRRPENIPFDGWRVVDSDDVLRLQNIPQEILIYGAGVIGCEYACIFASLGIETTIVDSRPVIMQEIDRQIAEELKRSMEQMGVKFELGYNLNGVKTKGPKALVSYGDKTREVSVFFFAAGRISNTDGLGLEKLDIKMNDRGAIVVNEHFQTTVPNIYAAGDAIGPPALAATSADQGRYACCHAFGSRGLNFPKIFPIGVYTIPELSSVGDSEEQLQAKGIDYVAGRSSFEEIARGYIRGDNHGLLKLLVCKKTHRILGIHIVGPDACNLIHIGLGIMLKGGCVQDLVDTMVFNYPTLAEGFRIAAFNALNKIFPSGVFERPEEPDQFKLQIRKVENQ